jgi:death-on-curing protein
MYVAVDNNVCNRSSLIYILDAIQNPIFGFDRFPSLVEKAAALCWWIIEGHIFNDGNKRTGMQAGIELLEINGTITHFNPQSLVDIATDVARAKISPQELASIFASFV